MQTLVARPQFRSGRLLINLGTTTVWFWGIGLIYATWASSEIQRNTYEA
jgi:hypothetical protein